MIIKAESLTITIKAAKNLQRHDQQRIVTVFKADNPAMCLIRAVHKVLLVKPTMPAAQPMFVFVRTVKPITVSLIRRHWQAALKAKGAPVTAITLHTLRKAAVITAFNKGKGERMVQHFGGWAADAYKTYIYKEKDLEVGCLLATSLKLKN